MVFNHVGLENAYFVKGGYLSCRKNIVSFSYSQELPKSSYPV